MIEVKVQRWLMELPSYLPPSHSSSALYLREIQVLKKETLAITHTNGAINTDIPSKGASGPPAAKAEHYTIIILYS